MSGRVLTIEEAAALLNVALSLVEQWREQGLLYVLQLQPGHKPRLFRAEVERLARQRQQEPS